MVKIASLFDGIGGTPLSARINGAECLWCSEIEKFPQAVTKHHFPNMKHYGDITKINGAEVEPVDIIVGGSPCQDLSVAGKRAGMKHTEFGDEETTRSGRSRKGAQTSGRGKNDWSQTLCRDISRRCSGGNRGKIEPG